MVQTASTMLPLGTQAPDFELPDTRGDIIKRTDFQGKPLLVVFMCNHCPFVKHLADALADFAREYQQRGLAIVGIASNDVEKYPQDNMPAMENEVLDRGYSFPYCLDETQEVAKQYRAACTPDFFLFDADHKLVYRGQFDDSRPNSGSPTGRDLRDAVEDMFVHKTPNPDAQKPSIGCNIKWKPGNEPDYFQS